MEHPANHYKFCPRCATAGKFNSESYAFCCNNCGFEFYLNASAAVAALILNEKGELLMVRRGLNPGIGMLDLPGGFVDPLESAEQSVMREVKEELDLEPVSVNYFGSFPNEYRFSGTIVYTVDLAFSCHVSDFSNLKFRDDVAGIEFVLPENIDFDSIAFQSIKAIVKKFIHEQCNK